MSDMSNTLGRVQWHLTCPKCRYIFPADTVHHCPTAPYAVFTGGPMNQQTDAYRIRDLEARLQAEIKRREEAEEVIRHYGDEASWIALDVYSGGETAGYDKAQEYLDKYAEGE
jgi:hypothetical protein